MAHTRSLSDSVRDAHFGWWTSSEVAEPSWFVYASEQPNSRDTAADTSTALRPAPSCGQDEKHRNIWSAMFQRAAELARQRRRHLLRAAPHAQLRAVTAAWSTKGWCPDAQAARSQVCCLAKTQRNNNPRKAGRGAGVDAGSRPGFEVQMTGCMHHGSIVTARRLSVKSPGAFEGRQALVFSGWQLARISSPAPDRRPTGCQRRTAAAAGRAGSRCCVWAGRRLPHRPCWWLPHRPSPAPPPSPRRRRYGCVDAGSRSASTSSTVSTSRAAVLNRRRTAPCGPLNQGLAFMQDAILNAWRSINNTAIARAEACLAASRVPAPHVSSAGAMAAAAAVPADTVGCCEPRLPRGGGRSGDRCWEADRC